MGFNKDRNQIPDGTLDIILLLDVSGSMHGKGIEVLNNQMKNFISELKTIVFDEITLNSMIEILTFSTDVKSHIERKPVCEVEWHPVSFGGLSNLGKAFEELKSKLDHLYNPIPPVLVLVTDGQPTEDYKDALKKLLSSETGKKATRLAVMTDDNTDIDLLNDFINNRKINPFKLENINEMIQFIKISPLNQTKTDVDFDKISLLDFDFDLPEDDLPPINDIYDKF